MQQDPGAAPADPGMPPTDAPQPMPTEPEAPAAPADGQPGM